MLRRKGYGRGGHDAASTGPQEGTRPSRLFGLYLGAFLSTFAFNAATVALPLIGHSLHANAGQQELVVAAYGAAFAALLVVGGRIGDLAGRRRMFIVGMTAFAFASAAAACAATPGILLSSRVLQGVGGALATPQILATIRVVVRPGSRLRAVAAFGAFGGLGAASGQVLGGVLVSWSPFGLGWRAIFVLCAALAVASAISARAVPETGTTVKGGIDPGGAAWLAAGIAALVVGVSIGPSAGWPWWTIALLALVPVLLLTLWRWESSREHRGRITVLAPRALRIGALQLSLLAAAVFFIGYGGLLYVVAIALQHGLGLSPLASGMSIAPMAVAVAAGSFVLQPVARRLGYRTMPIGAGIQALALASLVATVLHRFNTGTPWQLLPTLVILGLAQALLFGPLIDRVVGSLPAADAGLASGLFGTVQQLALALGVAAAGAVYALVDARYGVQTAFAMTLVLDSICALALIVITSMRSPHARVEPDRPSIADVPQARTQQSSDASQPNTSGQQPDLEGGPGSHRLPAKYVT
ncbi:MFS transporter [Streptomyces sp. NPDC001185]|uniref:MFS transporter n=1 Tax=Streptomyces sp. NPDC001185 TaxID=3154380 RepID=UPI003325493C